MKKLVALLLVLTVIFSMTIIVSATEAEVTPIVEETVAEQEERIGVIRITERPTTNTSETVKAVRSGATATSNLPQLGSATDLTWGVEHGYVLDPNTNTVFHDSRYDRQLPGMASYKRATLDQGRYKFELYQVGIEEPLLQYIWDIEYSYYGMTWVDEFLLDLISDSGDYYFAVTALGDGITYADGPTVHSETWHYVKPAKTLTTPSQVAWNWPYAAFSIADNEKDLFGIYIEFYHTDILGKEPQWAGALSVHYYTTQVKTQDWMLQDFGNGYYSFKVKLLSNDMNTIANSDWSDMSPVYKLTTQNSRVEDELKQIIASNATPEEIRNSIQAINTEDLKSAMLADTENSGVIANMATLETAIGGPAMVEVSPAVTAFDANKISINGANLNMPASEHNPITLVLDKPEKEHILDSLYKNTVAVSFSMNLENVKDTEMLEVPVKITLPVPSTIKPNILVILHCHANGTMEELHPYIYSENGQYYAQFLLTGFSDFIMTQYANEFKDVPNNAYYRDAVVWAVDNKVTSGTGDGTTFEPNAICTRGQVVTFLWRAAGQPEPKITENPFKDVKTTDYFYKAVLWALENQITTGTGDGTTFEPNSNCNRGQIVTFLSRAKNGKATTDVNPFKDVASNAYYYNPVLWAVENGITTGTGDGTTFKPNEDCTRGQVITFLYRAYTR